MIRYSVQPIDWIFLKTYGFLSFDKNMGINIGKHISKNLSGKYSQKPLDHSKQFVTDALKTVSESSIQKTTETTGDLIGNKIVNGITKISGSSLQNNLRTVTNEHANERPKERYISPEERQYFW